MIDAVLSTAIECPLYVLVTGDDQYPTWLPGTLPVWTSQEGADAFVAEHDLGYMQFGELTYDSNLLELFVELRQVGCQSITVDATEFTISPAVVPIDVVIQGLGEAAR